MDFYDTLKRVCTERGTSVSKVEKDLGFSNGSLAKGVPRADRLHKIAQYFDVPMEVFFKDDKYAFDWGNVNEKPLYRAAAGQGAYNGTYADDSIEVDDEDCEYATVIGNSMLPELRDGDVVKIQKQTETTPRDFTLVKVDGEHATIKYVEIVNDGVWLRAINKDVYADHFYTIQEVMTLPITIIGKVVELRRAL